jgi:BirA family transcriptional regulator, biotin operon repressor / biotin---[acetyl-CoA-carboxylase] ligase
MSNNQLSEEILATDFSLQRELDDILKNLGHLNCGLALKKLPSTNDHALRLEKQGQKSGTVVIASLQVQGRGRLKRPWYMDEGDIALSLLLRPPHIPKNLGLLPMAIALALVDALAAMGLKVWCKWPNDIIVASQDEIPTDYFGRYRKLGGILVENVFHDPHNIASVIGIGLNLTPKMDLKELLPHRGNLCDYLPSANRAICLKYLLTSLDREIMAFNRPSYEQQILKRYKENCATFGHQVIALLKEPIVGYACGIHDDGSLIIDDGHQQHRIFAGDVTLQR